MEDYVRAMIEPLVSDKEKFTVVKTADERGVLLTVNLSPVDMGKIIGKQGATIKAIRLLTHVWGQLHNATISIKVVEPVGGKHFQPA